MKTQETQDTEEKLWSKIKNTLTVPQKKALQMLDANGDGRVGIEDIMVQVLKLPLVHIERDDFLRKEFSRKHPQSQVKAIVKTTPLQAGIDPKEIDKIADEVIKFERAQVSGISALLGMPRGVTAWATLAPDIMQYYGYLFRAMQKLMYLYGFPQIVTGKTETGFDSEMLNVLMLCMGVMYGVNGANVALRSMAAALGRGMEKQLGRFTLRRGTIYPIVKSVAKYFDAKMSRKIYGQIVGKSIPVAGAVVGGGITFFTFKPCCDRLKATLKDTALSNPSHQETIEEKKMRESIEVEFREVN